jgi:hypothetical protein
MPFFFCADERGTIAAKIAAIVVYASCPRRIAEPPGDESPQTTGMTRIPSAERTAGGVAITGGRTA